MKKPQIIEIVVPYFEFFEDESFAQAVWRSSNELSFVKRILLIGMVSKYEKLEPSIAKNRIYKLKMKTTRNPLGYVSFSIAPIW